MMKDRGVNKPLYKPNQVYIPAGPFLFRFIIGFKMGPLLPALIYYGPGF